MDTNKELNIKMKHPQYGDVSFTRLTLRQYEVLKVCEKILNNGRRTATKRTKVRYKQS